MDLTAELTQEQWKMDLVNQLIASASSEDVLTVLRKARILSSKLEVSDIDSWLRSEQQGYEDVDSVPKYRCVKGTLVMHSAMPIPVGMGYVRSGIMEYPRNIVAEQPLTDPLAQLLQSCSPGSTDDICLTIDQDIQSNLRRNLNPRIAGAMSFLLRLSKPSVLAIAEAVKDKVLDWALELERRGIKGEGLSFTDQDKKLAHQVKFVINNSSIGQLSNSGTNSISRTIDSN